MLRTPGHTVEGRWAAGTVRGGGRAVSATTASADRRSPAPATSGQHPASGIRPPPGYPRARISAVRPVFLPPAVRGDLP